MEAELAKAQEGEGVFVLRNMHDVALLLTKRIEEIEPFDTKLAQRIQALSSQIEDHTLQLANLRRTAPAETSRRFQDSYTQASEQYDARLQRDEETRLQEAKNTKVEVDDLERLDEIQSTWQNGSEALMSLKSGLGGTVAKAERAQQVVSVLEER